MYDRGEDGTVIDEREAINSSGRLNFRRTWGEVHPNLPMDSEICGHYRSWCNNIILFPTRFSTDPLN